MIRQCGWCSGIGSIDDMVRMLGGQSDWACRPCARTVREKDIAAYEAEQKPQESAAKAVDDAWERNR